MLSQIIMTMKGAILLSIAVYAFAALLRPDDAKWVRGAPLKIFVGLYVIGMWGQVVWVPYLACLLIIPLLSKSRADAAAVYVVTLLAVPTLYFKMSVGGHYLFPLTKYNFCALGLALAYFSKPAPAVRLHRRFDIPIVIVLLLELAQARNSDLVEMTREYLPTLFTIAVPFYLLSRALNTREDVRRFALAFACGGFVLAVVAIAESRFHWLLYKQIDTYLHLESRVNSYQQVRGGMLRAPASFPESTSLGAFLAAGSIAVLAMKSSFATRGKWYIAVCVLLIGLIAPNSRNALIGVGIGFALFNFYQRKWARLFTVAGVGAALYLMLLTAAQFSSYAANLVGKGSETQSSNDYRMLLFKRGMEEVQRHPVLGTTLKNALDNLQDIRQGQNIVDLVNGYITYGLTSGYMGMVGLLMVFVSLMAAMLGARRKLRPDPLLSDLAALTFSVAGFMILIAAFTSFGGEGSTYFYLVAVLGSSLWALRRTAASPQRGVQPAPVAGRAQGIRAMILADRERAKRGGELSSVPTG